MLELTINETVYPFNFGMGFMREINKKVARSVDGAPDVKKNIGLQYYVASIMDGDVEALVDVLEIANKSLTPRVTRAVLDAFIDTVEDIDGIFDEVLDFLEQSNATKKTVKTLKDEIAKMNE